MLTDDLKRLFMAPATTGTRAEFVGDGLEIVCALRDSVDYLGFSDRVAKANVHECE